MVMTFQKIRAICMVSRVHHMLKIGTLILFWKLGEIFLMQILQFVVKISAWEYCKDNQKYCHRGLCGGLVLAGCKKTFWHEIPCKSFLFSSSITNSNGSLLPSKVAAMVKIGSRHLNIAPHMTSLLRVGWSGRCIIFSPIIVNFWW